MRGLREHRSRRLWFHVVSVSRMRNNALFKADREKFLRELARAIHV